MTLEELKKLCETIKKDGPTRTVITKAGQAVPSQKSAPPSIIFIRDDGWSLGASQNLAIVAEQMWADKWVGVFEKGADSPVLYGDWKAGRRP